jgi:hypothetical protein
MSIIIEGNPSFIAYATFQPKVQRCLNLLNTKASAYYTWLLKYNLKVRAAQRSGANFQDAAIDIASDTFNASDTWLASVLIHEAIHFWQYRDGHYQAGTVAEQEANRYQLGVLQLVGAPQGEITYMLSQNGGHADLNGDGVYDWRDYQLRNY